MAGTRRRSDLMRERLPAGGSEIARQRDLEPPCHRRVDPLLAALGRVPHRRAIRRPCRCGLRQHQVRGLHAALARVIVDLAGAFIHNPATGTIGRCSRRRAPFRARDGLHAQMVDRNALSEPRHRLPASLRPGPPRKPRQLHISTLSLSSCLLPAPPAPRPTAPPPPPPSAPSRPIASRVSPLTSRGPLSAVRGVGIPRVWPSAACTMILMFPATTLLLM